jgi:hypothetical protein
MYRFKKVATKSAFLFPVVFALSLAGIGQTAVTWDASAGVVWEMDLGPLGPAPLAAQVVCRDCDEQTDVPCEDVWQYESLFHPDVGEYCEGKSPTHIIPDVHNFGTPEWPCYFGTSDPFCRRCGGTSACHQDYWFGECHIECEDEGGGPDFAVLVHGLQLAIAEGDLGLTLDLLTARTGGDVVFETGHLLLTGGCETAVIGLPHRSVQIIAAAWHSLTDQAGLPAIAAVSGETPATERVATSDGRTGG